MKGMEKTREFVEKLGLPKGDLYDLPTSTKTFPDGAQVRIEIPSVEGPECMEAVLEEAEKRGVPVTRVSQGSGIMLTTEKEIKRMVELGADARIEVSLFMGPRAPFDIIAYPLTQAGKNLGWRVSGMDQVIFALEDIQWACELGLRGVLISDEGVLYLAGEMRKAGILPKDLVIKASAFMGHPNPVSVRIAAQLGANTYNVPSDLTLPRLAAIRAAVDIPIDLYVEVPDHFGGFIRFYEVPEIIRVAAPVYIKLGLRNARAVYPCGTHLLKEAIANVREEVRRAEIVCELVNRYYPEAKFSKPGATGLGIPVR